MDDAIKNAVEEIEKQIFQETDLAKGSFKDRWDFLHELTREQVKAVMANIIRENVEKPITSADIIERGIEEAVVACHFNAVEKQWWTPGPTFPEALMLVVSELAEALEDFRGNMEPQHIHETTTGKPIGIPIEMADAVIRIFDLCGGFKIPLAEAVRAKMAYNRSRPERHGGKKL